MTMLLDPRLSNCRRIFLNGLSVEASIGFHPHELRAAQRLRINVELFVPMAASTSQSDAVNDVLDYDFIRLGVCRLASQQHHNLQETLIDKIVALCLSRSEVRAARVSTEKPDVYPDCDTVGIEVFAWQQSQ
jgi:7,8-dihydroneopterin aldolase/epimerase/oxygenase